MTPALRDKLDLLRSTYPGCIWIETTEGLVVVRRPTAAEVIDVEDAVGSLMDLGSKPSPYSGLAEIKRVVVHPSQDKTEELLQSYPQFMTQLVGLMHVAAFGADGRPGLEESTLRDVELYQRELPPDGNGNHQKRCGGRLFAIEHYRVEERDPQEFASWEALSEEERALVPDQSPHRPRKVVVGRYLMRRMGLIDHREFSRKVAATGFLVQTRNGLERQPRASTWASVARTHAISAPAVQGVGVPDWEKHPYLLLLLGQAVRDQSALQLGSSEGKS